MTTPQFSTGIERFQKSLADAQKRKESFGEVGGRIGYFNWKSGDVKILRFLTDELLMENFHEFIVTTQTGRPIGTTGKVAGTQNFMIPPNDPHILDRYRSPYPGVGWRQKFTDKSLVEPKPREIGCGIAVLRDQKPGPDGKLIVEDYLYEQEIEGKSYLSRQFGIVQQSPSNFWHTLVVSCFAQFGTLCDRDYRIERSGGGLDTKYSIIPLGEDPDLNSEAKVKSFYFYGAKYDKDDPQRFLKCPQTLTEWGAYFAGEDRYKYWLTPGEGADKPKDGAAKQPVYQQPQPTPQPTYLQGGADEAQSGVGEFHPSTTHNPGPTSVASGPPASTNFSSFKDDLIKQAQAAEQNK